MTHPKPPLVNSPRLNWSFSTFDFNFSCFFSSFLLSKIDDPPKVPRFFAMWTRLAKFEVSEILILIFYIFMIIYFYFLTLTNWQSHKNVVPKPNSKFYCQFFNFHDNFSPTIRPQKLPSVISPRPNRGFIKKNLFVQFLSFHLIIDDLVYFWAISRKFPNFCFIFKDVLSMFSLSIVFSDGASERVDVSGSKGFENLFDSSQLFGEFFSIFHI